MNQIMTYDGTKDPSWLGSRLNMIIVRGDLGGGALKRSTQ
jgi:hypothetical protein